MAIQKRVVIHFTVRQDRDVRVSSDKATSDDWRKYVRAAIQALESYQPLKRGMDASITSDLPMAAGLSSSSALLTAVTLALMRVNDMELPLTELTNLLANGEQFVGTRGGAMDHVAILASRAGFATLIQSFEPLAIDHVPIPASWRFLVAHSLVHAEKSGPMRSEYNARREAGTRALQRHATPSDDMERRALLHITSEARRVQDAVAALRQADLLTFGRLLSESHASLRDNLRVSLPVVDHLVDCALTAGAFGARITGAGFGGCIVCLCTDQNVEQIRNHLIDSFYAHHSAFDPAQHLFIAQPVGPAF